MKELVNRVLSFSPRGAHFGEVTTGGNWRRWLEAFYISFLSEHNKGLHHSLLEYQVFADTRVTSRDDMITAVGDITREGNGDKEGATVCY